MHTRRDISPPSVPPLQLSNHRNRFADSIFSYHFFANVTELGPELRVCDAFKPYLWSLDLDMLKEWSCRVSDREGL